jgi:hypothetical protein
MEKYTGNDNWPDVFGKRVIMQKPEAMPLFPPDWMGKCHKFSYWTCSITRLVPCQPKVGFKSLKKP